MTPGLQRGPPFPSKAKKDAIVAIASLEKPSVPMVVGVCEVDVAGLSQVQGVKGHAVRGEHWDGDEIWAWSPAGKPGGVAPDHIEGWDVNDSEAGLVEGVEKLDVDDQEEDADEGGVSLANGSLDQAKVDARNDFVEGEDGKPYEEIGKVDKEMTTKGKHSPDVGSVRKLIIIEIDDIFWNAFLYGVHHHLSTHKSNPRQGLNLPMPQSLVISNLVLPYLPNFTSAQAASLQIKKTSWKNAKKFIKTLDKKKLLKSKDRDGGECVVLDIDFDDAAFTGFKPYRLPKKETAGADSGGGGGGKPVTSTASDDSLNQRLRLLTLYRPKDSLSPLFAASSASARALYLPTELRPIITAYIEAESLITTTNKRLVNLNPILANAVFGGNSPLDRDVIAKGTVPRDALIDRILQSCAPFHAILRNDDTRENAKAKAGAPPKIHIVLETRSGNKTVTKLSGVEAFHISPQPLADELQKACASSTSVGQLVGSSPKNPVMEILVQGPQKDVVVKALERRGVRREWVEVLDKTKGKKKG